MQRSRRLGHGAHVGDVQLASTPRVAISRESVWLVQVPGRARRARAPIGAGTVLSAAPYPGTRHRSVNGAARARVRARAPCWS
jgi:hypothetical protein